MALASELAKVMQTASNDLLVADTLFLLLKSSLHWIDYQQYLQTNYWKELRKLALDKAGNRCQICNSPSQLRVHHRTYSRRGFEDMLDLTVLCDPCHSLFHQRLRLADAPAPTGIVWSNEPPRKRSNRRNARKN
jgi:hypothetical protein